MSNDWRRQKVQDHKFDFIDVDDYVDNSFYRRMRYMLVFGVVIKGILVYCADLWTTVNLLMNSSFNSAGVDVGGGISAAGIKIDYSVYKWIFAGCIILSFILLSWDMKKAAAVIKSRDISYAFTSMIAYRYYAIKSYPHFCLFEKIHNSKKTIDEIAFFCFFTFRGWKRLIFADGPRQVINGLILYKKFFPDTNNGNFTTAAWTNNPDIMSKITTVLQTFTLLVWTLSILYMIVAVFLYIPLVIQIQGNLKEFCCHKIDKRIDEIVKKKAKQRATEATKKSGKPGAPDNSLQKPTLPNLNLIEGGGGSPMGTPRMGNATPQMTPRMAPGMAPGMRKGPLPADPYRRNQTPQMPARPYSPSPRPYTPSMDEDSDTKPLQAGNYQQMYHNQNLRRQDQQYEFRDDQSEISDNMSGITQNSNNYLNTPHQARPGGHKRMPSDTSTVLSGSNAGSVISGQGRPSPGRSNLHHGQTLAREAGLGGGPYADTVMMTDMGHRGPPRSGTPDPYGGLQGGGAYRGPTGLGGGVNQNPGGSVFGGSAAGYGQQQQGHAPQQRRPPPQQQQQHHQQHHQHQQQPYY